MKKFERFIIYPMLFIALFFSFADYGVQQTTAQQVYDEIIAKSIKVVDDEGNVRVGISTNKVTNSGTINIRNTHSGNFLSLGPSFDDEGFVIAFMKKSDSDKSVLNYFMPLEIGHNGKYSFINLKNSNGDKQITISSDENGHGLINVYDKYGEEWMSYDYK